MMLQFSFTTDTSCQVPGCDRMFPLHPDFFTGVEVDGKRLIICFQCIQRVKRLAAGRDTQATTQQPWNWGPHHG